MYITGEVHQIQLFFYSTIPELPVYATAYLSDYNPCSFSNHAELFKNTDDKYLIDTTLLELDKWIHVKSKVFSPDKPMTWFWLGYGTGDGLYGIRYRYLIYWDDVIIRKAGTGINSTVSSYYPCIGDTIEYKFKIWKEDPEDESDI